MLKPLIEINNLCLDYPFRDQNKKRPIFGFNKATSSHRALHNLTMHISQGERVGILGANGSGKSTLLKVISGILHPTSGKIVVRGRLMPLIDMNSGFFPELTGKENLILMGLMLGESLRTMKSKLDELIELSGISDFADVPIRDYSSGMAARLAFSLVCSLKADVMVLDEVLSTTDASFMVTAEKRLDQLISNSGCALIVSHDLDFLSRICTKIIWLDQGKIKAVGQPAEICLAYQDWSLQSPRTVAKSVNSPGTLSL